MDRGIEYINEVEDKLKEYDRYIVKYKLIQFYFFFAYLYYLKTDYDNVLVWLNKIINEGTDEISPEIMSFSRILQLIVHYEKEDFDLLEYLIKSTRRFFIKAGTPFKYEKLFLDFLQKLLDSGSGLEIKGLASEFRKNLLVLLDDQSERNAIENLDLLTWAESKIQDRPIVEILREKLGKAKVK
jgi:hypothetical protein